MDQNFPHRQLSKSVISVFADSAEAPAAIIAVFAKDLFIQPNCTAIDCNCGNNRFEETARLKLVAYRTIAQIIRLSRPSIATADSAS